MHERESDNGTRGYELSIGEFDQGPVAFQFLSKDRPLPKAFAIGPKKPAIEVISSLISYGVFFNLFLQ